tara:strand:- start:645 stop:1757 length:1113 start_codon:yes stop_codon:yes gene_type:complete
MAKLKWSVWNISQSSLDVTQYVQSLSFTLGRPSPLTAYSGNSASVTMFSYGGIENYVNVQDELLLFAEDPSGAERSLFLGRITSRTFDDNPGSGINSTMTVSLSDAMLQAGVANLQSAAFISLYDQINEIVGLLPQIELLSAPTDIAMAVGTFTTNANQRINEIISGDRGVIANFSGLGIYYPPREFNGLINTSIDFGRTASATQVAYQDINRVEAASNSLFYTQATVTGSASTVTMTALDSAYYFGVRTFTATTAQSEKVSETAEWYANAFVDPEIVVLNLSFTDVAQNDTALAELNTLFAITKFVEVRYTPPGGTEITGYFWPEQITFNATTSQTTIDMVMTPLSYYGNFTLDDSVLGVLDTDRLGVS